MRDVITHPVKPGVNDPKMLAFNTATTRAVRPGHESFTLNIVDSDAWPWAAAAALALQREGHPATVIPTKTWASLLGPLPARAAHRDRLLRRHPYHAARRDGPSSGRDPY